VITLATGITRAGDGHHDGQPARTRTWVTAHATRLSQAPALAALIGFSLLRPHLQGARPLNGTART
jgi:hypothetical protein